MSPKAGESPLQKSFDEYSTVTNDDVSKCFNTPNSVSLNVEDLLDIPTSGWTKIQKGINDGIWIFSNSVFILLVLLFILGANMTLQYLCCYCCSLARCRCMINVTLSIPQNVIISSNKLLALAPNCLSIDVQDEM